MPHDPFAPPNSDVVDHIPDPVPWHLAAVAGLLALIGAWGFVASVVGLTRAAMPDLPLWFYYLALLPPLLTLFAANSLWRRNKWCMAFLAAAPILGLSTYLFVASARRVSYASTLAAQVMDILPPAQLAQLGIFAAAILYCAFLYKWGHLR